MSAQIPKRWQNHEAEIKQVFFNHRSLIKYERRLRPTDEIDFDDTALEKSWVDFWKFASKIDPVLDDNKKVVLLQDRCNVVYDYRRMATHLTELQEKMLQFLIEQYLRFWLIFERWSGLQSQIFVRMRAHQNTSQTPNLTVPLSLVMLPPKASFPKTKTNPHQP